MGNENEYSNISGNTFESLEEKCIYAIKLPNDFFCHENEDSQSKVFKHVINGDILTRLSILDKKGYKYDLVLLSIYAFLLSETAEKGNIVIQKVISDSNAIQLDMDLSVARDMVALLKTVKRNVMEAELVNSSYNIKTIDFKGALTNRNNIIVAYADKGNISLKDFALCHFLFKTYMNNENIFFELEYDVCRIKSSKAGEFFRWYIKTTELMLSKIKIKN